jgi:DNA-binding transcriptional LysR family regulator
MNPEIELRHLRYFVAVAEELHFGRAAQRLHLAQPPLSQQIRKLEEILGHRLFTRTSREVKLTSAGEVFFERARRTLLKVQEDLEEARGVGRGEVGFLKVGLIGSGMLTGVPAMLGEYRRQYPKVNLRLREMFTSGVMQALARGDLDAGIVRDGGPAEGLKIEVLFSEPFVAVLPINHARAQQEHISAADLRDDPFVFFPRSAGNRAYSRALALFEKHGFQPNIVQEAPHWLTILRLVGAGLGVAIAPACVEQIGGPGVVCLDIRHADVQSDIELVYRAGEDRTIVRAFAAIARSSFRAHK